MKKDSRQTGQKGEELARDYLIESGYRILECNWRHSRAEIDIIAQKNDTLIFVEVKTRSSRYFGTPGEFLSPQQERRIADAAYAYCIQVEHDWEIRFDLIEVLLIKGKKPAIQHFPDAFYPGD